MLKSPILLIIFLQIIIFSSCKNAFVTQNEQNAVQEVLNFYGGICNRSKGFHTKNGNTETYFKLEMEKSALLESYSGLAELPASNIAYLFYSNLGNEQKNYTHIKVSIKFNNGGIEDFEFSAWRLKQIKEFIPILNSISDDVKYQRYNSLYSKFDPEIAIDLSSDQLKSFCFPQDSAYGLTKQYQFQGFAFFYDDNNKPLIKLVNFMIREKANTPLIVVLDKKKKTLLTLQNNFE